MTEEIAKLIAHVIDSVSDEVHYYKALEEIAAALAHIHDKGYPKRATGYLETAADFSRQLDKEGGL